MGFLDWLSKRNREYRKWVEYRRKYLAEWIFEFVEDRERKGIPQERWVYALSPNDLSDLTGEKHSVGDAVLFQSHKGVVVINCRAIGDRRPMRYDSKTDPPLDRLG